MATRLAPGIVRTAPDARPADGSTGSPDEQASHTLFGPTFPSPHEESLGGAATASLLGALNQFERRNAPPRLFLAGDANLLQTGRRVSVVGSRRADSDALNLARSVTEKLVGADIIVVSGLATGIDTVAHQVAIERAGRTIAVLGTPLSQRYPPSNAQLQHTIAKNHLVVSQFPEGSSVQPRNFAMRNRTMALISDATVIVDASAKSGTRHQGWEAINLGRHLALMEPLASSGIDWVEEQIRFGAEPLCLDQLSNWCDSIHERSAFDESIF